MTSYGNQDNGPQPSTGSLSPTDTALETLDAGTHHLTEPITLCLLKNLLGGLLISAGGTLSFLLAYGFPSLSASNPGFPYLAQGLTFPIGLVITYLMGGELFTGYPMWLAMTALSRQGKPMQYLRAVLFSLAGNLLGCLVWTSLVTFASETLTDEPWRSGIIEQVDSEVTDEQWHVIFVRAIGCGFLVTFAMVLGTQQRDGISKALGLHLPFFVSCVAKYPHTVEMMFQGCTGLLLGARLTVGMFLWKCMLPTVLGNTLGGAFIGAYHWYVFVGTSDDGKHRQSGNGGTWLPVDDE